MSSPSSPLPWKAEATDCPDCYDLLDGRGARVWFEHKEDAEFVALAVNSYHKIMGLLDELVHDAEQSGALHPEHPDDCGCALSRAREILRPYRAALKASEGI